MAVGAKAVGSVGLGLIPTLSSFDQREWPQAVPGEV